MREKISKNEKWIGILLVPVLLCLLVLVVNLFVPEPKVSFQDKSDSYVEEEVRSYEGCGYGKEKEFPQALTNLISSGLFSMADDMEEEYEEEEYAEEESDYTSSYEYLLDSNHFLKESPDFVVEDVSNYPDYNMQVPFSLKKGTFSSQAREKIQAVEQCGFVGFGEQMTEVEKNYKQWFEVYGDSANSDDTGISYVIFNQGIGFYIYIEEGGNAFISLNLNIHNMYIPQKYKSIIESVTQSGDYMLRASSVGNEKEVLTFAPANGVEVECNDGLVGLEKNYLFGDKRISFIFKKGQLENYYVTTNEKKLELTEQDKKVIETVAGGIQKTLPKRADYMDKGNGVKIYIAK